MLLLRNCLLNDCCNVKSVKEEEDGLKFGYSGENVL